MGSFDKSCMSSASFENEQELQTALAEHPQLLVVAGAAPPILLIPKLTLPGVGAMGVFLLAVESIPIVVATVVGTSADVRGEMLARAIDAIAAMARLTVEQLDMAAGGAVHSTLTTLADGDPDEFDRRWMRLGVNLRAARVRFVVAVDERQPSLDRTIGFLAAHSSLDVQCVAVVKYREVNGDSYYASTIAPGAAGTASEPLTSSPSTRQERAVTLDPLDQPPWSNAMRLVGSPGSHRKQAPPPWRVSASSRFVKRAGVWTETHGEEPDAAGSHSTAARGGETPPDVLARVQWDG